VTLVDCEACGQRVTRMFQAQTGPDAGRWRVVRHKSNVPAGRFRRIDWCRGRYERQEATMGPLIASHAFQKFTYPEAGKTICIYRDGGRICDRPEQEHAPASTSSETGA
jgi:hypothetical protein